MVLLGSRLKSLIMAQRPQVVQKLQVNQQLHQ